jgi:hypothetical protein
MGNGEAGREREGETKTNESKVRRQGEEVRRWEGEYVMGESKRELLTFDGELLQHCTRNKCCAYLLPPRNLFGIYLDYFFRHPSSRNRNCRRGEQIYGRDCGQGQTHREGEPLCYLNRSPKKDRRMASAKKVRTEKQYPGIPLATPILVLQRLVSKRGVTFRTTSRRGKSQ